MKHSRIKPQDGRWVIGKRPLEDGDIIDVLWPDGHAERLEVTVRSGWIAREAVYTTEVTIDHHGTALPIKHWPPKGMLGLYVGTTQDPP